MLAFPSPASHRRRLCSKKSSRQPSVTQTFFRRRRSKKKEKLRVVAVLVVENVKPHISVRESCAPPTNSRRYLHLTRSLTPSRKPICCALKESFEKKCVRLGKKGIATNTNKSFAAAFFPRFTRNSHFYFEGFRRAFEEAIYVLSVATTRQAVVKSHSKGIHLVR